MPAMESGPFGDHRRIRLSPAPSASPGTVYVWGAGVGTRVDEHAG
jgi:hypothetical protein